MKAVHLLVGAVLVMAMGFINPAWAVKTTETQLSGETTIKLPNGTEVKVKATKKIVKLKEPGDPADTQAKVEEYVVDGMTIVLTFDSADATTPTKISFLKVPTDENSNARKKMNEIYDLMKKSVKMTDMNYDTNTLYWAQNLYFTVVQHKNASEP